MKENDLVTVAPEIMQDLSVKSNHHIFKRVIETSEVGTIKYLDLDKLKETRRNLYWVKFAFASIRIDEKYLIPVDTIG